jgi:hypothetical protein
MSEDSRENSKGDPISIPAENRRLAREKNTVRAMIEIYCRGIHSTATGGSLCTECQTLLDYAVARLDRCPFGGEKPPCAKCSVHCYKPTLRERVKAVMRYAGPRMLWKHPILALRHQLDSFCGKFGNRKKTKCIDDPESNSPEN